MQNSNLIGSFKKFKKNERLFSKELGSFVPTINECNFIKNMRYIGLILITFELTLSTWFQYIPLHIIIRHKFASTFEREFSRGNPDLCGSRCQLSNQVLVEILPNSNMSPCNKDETESLHMDFFDKKKI